ncbi:MAG: aldehyde dehydrogenase family protein [Novosphingobium sp.]|nr:aldehyde dehydrogenase family protein [Novosphingobium sp.]
MLRGRWRFRSFLECLPRRVSRGGTVALTLIPRPAREQGAELLTGGQPPADTGYFVAPHLFAYTDPSIRIVQEEIFGPVLVATPFGGFKESDWGRELGDEGMEAYIETKAVYVNLT